MTTGMCSGPLGSWCRMYHFEFHAVSPMHEGQQLRRIRQIIYLRHGIMGTIWSRDRDGMFMTEVSRMVIGQVIWCLTNNRLYWLTSDWCQCNLHDNNDATTLPQDAHAEQYSCLNVTTYLKQLQHSKTDFKKTTWPQKHEDNSTVNNLVKITADILFTGMLLFS